MWTAFDVFINIPHLTLFPKDRVWFPLHNADATLVPSPGLRIEGRPGDFAVQRTPEATGWWWTCVQPFSQSLPGADLQVLP